MRYWVKLHTEILHKPMMIRLTWAEMGIWTRLLTLAGEVEDYDADGDLTGRLDTLDNVACRLYGSVEEFTPTTSTSFNSACCTATPTASSTYPTSRPPRPTIPRPYACSATASARPLPSRHASITPMSHRRYASVTQALRRRCVSVT